MDVEQCWYKTRTPSSMDEWRWMAKNVWGTNYDFTKPLVMKKKKRRKKGKYGAFQASISSYQRRDTCKDENSETKSSKNKKKVKVKRQKENSCSLTRSPPPAISVFVSTPLASTLNITISPNADVLELKGCIAEQLGIASEKQELYTGSLKMSNLLTLADYGVKDQSNVQLKLCAGLLGGADRPAEPSTDQAANASQAQDSKGSESSNGDGAANAETQAQGSTVTGSEVIDPASNIQAPEHISIQGDYNILVTGHNNTVNVTRSPEIHEMRVRLDIMEAEHRRLAMQHNMLLQIVLEHNPQLLQYLLRNEMGRLDRIGRGSVNLFVRFSSQQELENLWEMYEKGELKADISRILDLEQIHEAESLQLEVYIDEKDYRRGIDTFKQHAEANMPMQRMVPMTEWTIDMLKEILLMEGISEHIANEFYEEEVNGRVFSLYREDDMASDFRLKKGPLRNLLYIREKYTSDQPTVVSQNVPLPKQEKLSHKSAIATRPVPATALSQPHQSEKSGNEHQQSILTPQEEFTQVLEQEQEINEASKSVKQDTPVDVDLQSHKKQSQLEPGARPKIPAKVPAIPSGGGPNKSSGPSKPSQSEIEVEKQLRELLLGDAKLSLDESYQPILVVNKPTDTDLSSGQNILNNLSFIVDVTWKVVFDFYELSNQDGLCHYFSDLRKPSLQLPETVESVESVKDLEQADNPVWIFCNGREDDSNIDQPALSRPKWNEERSKDVEGAISLIAKQSAIPSSRSVIVFLVLSDSNIGILSDTFRKFFSEFRGMDNITCVVEDDEVYKIWEDEVKKWCDVLEFKKRSIVGVPLPTINRIMHRMSRVNVTSDKTLPLIGQRSVYIDERDIKKWKDISVVCQNECKNTDMDEDHPEFEKFIKEKELQFYRGHKPEWWNFELTDGPFNDGKGYNHILKRTKFDELQNKINRALQGALSSDLIITITMFHQPGCGASTLGRHQLWAFHKEYRCMIVDRVTPSTARQILDVRKYKYNEQSDCLPVLVLVDDLEDAELTELISNLENLSKELIVKGVLCVLLYSKRTPDPETLLKRGNQRFGFVLQQELDTHERDWFQKKYKELERKDLEDELKTGDYKPERLIAFMVMKNECNPKYVHKIVAETLSDLSKKSTKEYDLLKYSALFNSYLGDAAIPVSSCDEFMATSATIKTRRQTSTTTATRKNVPWEKTLSPASQMLMINVRITGTGIRGIKIVHQCVAEDILRQVIEEKSTTLGDIVLELLNSDLFRSASYSRKHLKWKMHDLLIRRKKYDLGDSEETWFAPIIERIYNEDKAKAFGILESAHELLSHAQYAQQAARLCYIREKDYARAHSYAKQAITLQPNHPYLLDTEAQIYRREIKEEYAQKYQNENKILPMKESQNLVRLAMSAIDTFKKARLQAQIMLSSLSSQYQFFGEVDIAFILIQIIDHCTPTFRQPGGREKLKDYLLTDAIPDGLQEWAGFHQFFKNLKSSIDDSMQEMDNLLTFCKDASSQNRMAHELDLKKRQHNKFHGLYIDYFGERLDTTPPSHVDSADWRRRQVSAIGADNFHRIFGLARIRDNAENSAKLKKVIDLLSQNKPYTYFDLRNMICAILALSALGSREKQVPTEEEVYEMVVQLKDRATHLKNEMYASFFLLMFLWPHPDDTVHRIKLPQTLKGQLNDLETRWNTNWAGNERDAEEEKSVHYKYRRKFVRQKPSTFFFFGRGKGLSRFVHIYEFNATPSSIQSESDPFWEKKRIQERLMPLNGTLYNNTHLSYLTPTKDQLLIRLALPKAEVYGQSQDPVTFYLGFSWGGPVAYNVKPAGRQRTNYRPKTYKTAYPKYLIPKRVPVDELEARLAQNKVKKSELQKQLQQLEKIEQKKKQGGTLTTGQMKKLKRKQDIMKDLEKLQESMKKDQETLSHVPEDDIFEIM